MNPVFLLNDKTLCIRRLKEADLQHSYYDVMSLLSEIDRTMLRTTIDNLENEYFFFVIEDINTQMLIGTGTVIITNKTNNININQIGYIENIMIRQDYQNIGLGEIILQRLSHYCLTMKKCLNVIINCDATM